MATFDDGKTGFSLGTNIWGGDKGMSEFNQRTGVMAFRSGDFKFTYENDGFPFGFLNKNETKEARFSPRLGDGQDRYRSAAASLSIGEFGAGFNIFTGDRDQENETKGQSLIDSNGKLFKHGYANEVGTPYRLGAGYISYQGFRAGINSERHISYPIQARFAHGVLPQGGFPIINYNTSAFFQYHTVNNFTSW